MMVTTPTRPSFLGPVFAQSVDGSHMCACGIGILPMDPARHRQDADATLIRSTGAEGHDRRS